MSDTEDEEEEEEASDDGGGGSETGTDEYEGECGRVNFERVYLINVGCRFSSQRVVQVFLGVAVAATSVGAMSTRMSVGARVGVLQSDFPVSSALLPVGSARD